MKITIIQIRRTARLAMGLIPVAIAGASILGCGASSPRTVAAHKIADRLPALIGPARHYEVAVDADTFALGRGHVKRVVIKGEDVTMSHDLTVDTLTVEASDISVDPSSQKLEHIGPVTFEGTIGQGHLDNYIANKKPEIPGIAVDLRWNDLQASVPVSAGSFSTTARLSGTLSPNGSAPDKLDFVANRASVGIVPLPTRLVNLALKRLNPTIDLSSARFPVAIESADIVRGKLVVRGRAKISMDRIAVVQSNDSKFSWRR